MTTIYLIRHADRDTPSDLLAGRAAGIRLSSRGVQEAEGLPDRLRNEPIHRIFSSPLQRALDTAAPLARERRLPVEQSAALDEMNFGQWTGRRLGELADDPTWCRFNRLRSATRIPGGETAIEVQHRMAEELLGFRDRFPRQGVVCVSHADPIRFVVCFFLGMPLDMFDRLEVAPASITVLALADWGARLVQLNGLPPP